MFQQINFSVKAQVNFQRGIFSSPAWLFWAFQNGMSFVVFVLALLAVQGERIKNIEATVLKTTNCVEKAKGDVEKSVANQGTARTVQYFALLHI